MSASWISVARRWNCGCFCVVRVRRNIEDYYSATGILRRKTRRVHAGLHLACDVLQQLAKAGREGGITIVWRNNLRRGGQISDQCSH